MKFITIKENIRKSCDECAGNGKVFLYYTSMTYTDCPKCKGEGYITKMVEKDIPLDHLKNYINDNNTDR